MDPGRVLADAAAEFSPQLSSAFCVLLFNIGHAVQSIYWVHVTFLTLRYKAPGSEHT